MLDEETIDKLWFAQTQLGLAQYKLIFYGDPELANHVWKQLNGTYRENLLNLWKTFGTKHKQAFIEYLNTEEFHEKFMMGMY